MTQQPTQPEPPPSSRLRPGRPPQSTPPGALLDRFRDAADRPYRWSPITGQEIRMRCLEAAVDLSYDRALTDPLDNVAGQTLEVAQRFRDWVERPPRDGPMLHITAVEEVADAIYQALSDYPDDWTDPVEVDHAELRQWLADLRRAAV